LVFQITFPSTQARESCCYNHREEAISSYYFLHFSLSFVCHNVQFVARPILLENMLLLRNASSSFGRPLKRCRLLTGSAASKFDEVAFEPTRPQFADTPLPSMEIAGPLSFAEPPVITLSRNAFGLRRSIAIAKELDLLTLSAASCSLSDLPRFIREEQCRDI